MKQELDKLDDFLRESLEGYVRTPSPGLWKRISLILFFRSSWIYLSGLALLIATGMLVLWPSPSTELNEQTELATSSADEESREHNGLASVSAMPAPPAEKHMPPAVGQSGHEPDLQAGQRMPTGNREPDGPGAKGPAGDNAKPFDVTARYEYYANLREGFPLLTTPLLRNEKGKTINWPAGPAYPTRIFPRNYFDPVKGTQDYAFRRTHGLILQVSPELIFNGKENQERMEALNIDLGWIMEGQGGFLQAGAGIGLSHDDGIFDVHYNQYDSIGYYERVTSFAVDPVTGQPVFNTSPEGVFDTVSYEFTEKRNNVYYYLRVPVSAGIHLFEAGRIALHASAGATYSVLLARREPGYTYNNEKATGIRVIDNTPERIRSNLQLSIGTGLRYRLGPSTDLRMDVLYNYYWKNVLQNQEKQKTPWSVSLRVGMVFKL